MYPIKINQIPINKSQGRNINTINTQNAKFESLLNKAIQKNQDIKFSKHALERLQERKIELTTQEVDKLNNAITKAATKGIKETLIIMGNKAFIASVQNKTVITAAVDSQLKDNIFTNIDGAIFV